VNFSIAAGSANEKSNTEDDELEKELGALLTPQKSSTPLISVVSPPLPSASVQERDEQLEELEEYLKELG